MISLHRLTQDGNYIFPCRTYDDYLCILRAAEGYTGFGNYTAEEKAQSLFRIYADKGAVRITIGYQYRDVGWSDFDFYESGGYGPCVIMEISDVYISDDFGEFNSYESDLSCLLMIGGSLYA